MCGALVGKRKCIQFQTRKSFFNYQKRIFGVGRPSSYWHTITFQLLESTHIRVQCVLAASRGWCAVNVIAISWRETHNSWLSSENFYQTIISVFTSKNIPHCIDILLTFLQVCLMCCWQLSSTFGSRHMAVSFGGLCTTASKVFERMVVVVGWVITTLDAGQDTTGYMAL